MKEASQKELWFNFKPEHLGQKITPLEPLKYIKYKNNVINLKGKAVGTITEVEEINL